MLNQCLSMLKRDDVKKEMKHLFLPFIHILFHEYKPYLYFLYFLFLVNIGVSSIILFKLKST
jgi:hypothetical protein